MSLSVEELITKWSASGAAERSNSQPFLVDLCDVLGVERPSPATGNVERDTYVFERDARILHEGGVVTLGKIDLYKERYFILEAKQGSEAGSKKIGTAKRGTPAWHIAMRDAFGQALGYARSLESPPPFLITCDVGYCFDLYATFDGTCNYRPYEHARASRIFLKDLGQHAETLRRIFVDPWSLDPSVQAAKVTREVAAHLAELAKTLEEKHPPEAVAEFLMRCIFTMFAEDVGLIPEHVFRKAIKDYWIPNPPSFPVGVESLWRAMNSGGDFGLTGKLRCFNGGVFANPSALPLTKGHLKLLLEAAEHNWAEVDPAIFGTLLERALDPEERHRLGAHYTPRAYVERLVRPTVEAPLRAEWELVQAEVRQIVIEAGPEVQRPAVTEEEARALGKKQDRALWVRYRRESKSREDKLAAARTRLSQFHRRLTQLRVLDPACGSGNFLYVTLNLFKELEGEILVALQRLGQSQELLSAQSIRVTPAQLLGIEVKRWAKEIAELVLWIGYLQWHFRNYSRQVPVPEPVLRDYGNVEHRDALIDYDRMELVRDANGKPVMRWDGVTYKKSPVTGEAVPDERAQVPQYEYLNPREASWPSADFIVGNPPFLGTKRMRATLGDGYVDAVRQTYAGDVEDNADYVMYWWHKAGALLREGKIRRFGFITTNSVTQSFNRRVLSNHLDHGVRIIWAIPDHPWTDSETGAAVRIAMTCATADAAGEARLQRVIEERASADGDEAAALKFEESVGGIIRADLRMGADLVSVRPLLANAGISGMGVALHGSGFILTPDEAKRLRVGGKASTIRRYLGGRDLLQVPRERYVIDFSFLSEEQAAAANPVAFQHVVDHVLPERRHNRRDSIRTLWWRYGWERRAIRNALKGLPRYIATTETARHRIFQFVDRRMLPDHMLVVIASDDAFVLGVLSSRIHCTWALAAGGRLGVGNDPRYNKRRCLDPFAFPACSEEVRDRIRSAGEALDRHRKERQAAHPDLTMTAVYNVLEKLRRGETLTPRDKEIHERGLVSVLRRLHENLDAATFHAYGWPGDLDDAEILERLAALNAERTREERRGLVRWIRPEIQAPAAEERSSSQIPLDGLDGDEGEDGGAAADTKFQGWPKGDLPRQVALVRDTVAHGSRAWTAGEVARCFKGAKLGDVEQVLDSLAAVGVLVMYEAEGQRRWRSAPESPREGSAARPTPRAR